MIYETTQTHFSHTSFFFSPGCVLSRHEPTCGSDSWHCESCDGNKFSKNKRQRMKQSLFFVCVVNQEQRLFHVMHAVPNMFLPGLFAQSNAGKEELVYCEAALMRQAHCPLCPLFHTARCTCSAVCRPFDPPVTVMASVIWK